MDEDESACLDLKATATANSGCFQRWHRASLMCTCLHDSVDSAKSALAFCGRHNMLSSFSSSPDVPMLNVVDRNTSFGHLLRYHSSLSHLSPVRSRLTCFLVTRPVTLFCTARSCTRIALVYCRSTPLKCIMSLMQVSSLTMSLEAGAFDIRFPHVQNMLPRIERLRSLHVELWHRDWRTGGNTLSLLFGGIRVRLLCRFGPRQVPRSRGLPKRT